MVSAALYIKSSDVSKADWFADLNFIWLCLRLSTFGRKRHNRKSSFNLLLEIGRLIVMQQKVFQLFPKFSVAGRCQMLKASDGFCAQDIDFSTLFPKVG